LVAFRPPCVDIYGTPGRAVLLVNSGLAGILRRTAVSVGVRQEYHHKLKHPHLL
jgi:hypothetical protein